MTTNPNGYKPQNPYGQASVLSDSDFARLVQAAPSDKYRLLWVLQRATAARISEALALTWGDITATHVRFRPSTTKTGEGRAVPISAELRAELDRVGRQACQESSTDTGTSPPSELTLNLATT